MSGKRGNRGGFNPFRDTHGRWAASSSGATEAPPDAAPAKPAHTAPAHTEPAHTAPAAPAHTAPVPPGERRGTVTSHDGVVEVREVRENATTHYDVWNGDTLVNTHHAGDYVGRGYTRGARTAAEAEATRVAAQARRSPRSRARAAAAAGPRQPQGLVVAHFGALAVRRVSGIDAERFEVWDGPTFLSEHALRRGDPAAETTAATAASTALAKVWQKRMLAEPIPADVPKKAADGRTRDDLSRRQFNGRFTVKTSSTEAEIAGATTRIFGRPLSIEEVSRLSGAPDGAHVTVRAKANTIEIGIAHPLYAFPSKRTLRKGRTGPAIHNDLLFLRDDAPKGFGTRILAAQVRAARELGVTQLDLIAGGHHETRGEKNHMNGYSTWPRLGYVGTLTPEHIAQARKDAKYAALPDRATTKDLFDLPDGKDWWLDHGHQLPMVFDLTEGSHSTTTLNKKLTEKGIVL